MCASSILAGGTTTPPPSAMPKPILVKPELLAPAGNVEKLEIAIHYGADAVYLAGKDFSLRNFSGNFTDSELEMAIGYAHDRGVKVYVACNIYSRNSDQDSLSEFLERMNALGPDALIVADPGVIHLARQHAPQLALHLSTQANTTNYSALEFWKAVGITRANLARELCLDEIRDIVQTSCLETEVFVHGAMCISYSGRCLLSSFLSGRDSNRGLCTHPCRWNYSVVEELRPGSYHSLMEDDRGSYIFNSKDLCMIDHIPELVRAGIKSLKIEGRMKGINYLATVVKTYREALDLYMEDPDRYAPKPRWHQELSRLFHREYSTGFFFNQPDHVLPNYSNSQTGMIHSFIGKAIFCSPHSGGTTITLDVKNKLSVGSSIEILSPRGKPVTADVKFIQDTSGNPLENAQPNTRVCLTVRAACSPWDIIRASS
ncbi:MAG: U32 family peptidase [Pseudomonadota bacterium]